MGIIMMHFNWLFFNRIIRIYVASAKLGLDSCLWSIAQAQTYVLASRNAWRVTLPHYTHHFRNFVACLSPQSSALVIISLHELHHHRAVLQPGFSDRSLEHVDQILAHSN